MADQKTISQRLYVKGGSGRYYMDARDLVGRRIALVPDGERFATRDPDVAFRVAERWIADLGKEAEGGTETGDHAAEAHAAEPKIVHFDEYARRYFSHRVSIEKLASSTAKRYNQSLRFFRGFLQKRGLGNIPLAEISTTLINDFLAHRADMPGIRAEEKMSSQTLRNDVYALSGLLEYACEEGVIQDNPASKVRLPRQDGKEPPSSRSRRGLPSSRSPDGSTSIQAPPVVGSSNRSSGPCSSRGLAGLKQPASSWTTSTWIAASSGFGTTNSGNSRPGTPAVPYPSGPSTGRSSFRTSWPGERRTTTVRSSSPLK